MDTHERINVTGTEWGILGQ